MNVFRVVGQVCCEGISRVGRVGWSGKWLLSLAFDVRDGFRVFTSFATFSLFNCGLVFLSFYSLAIRKECLNVRYGF